MNEVWRIHKDWPYEVSNLGRVRRLPNTSRTGSKIMSPGTTRQGYKFVYLFNGGKSTQTYKSIHRLVAETFIRPLDNYEVVHHKDNDPSNNILENLEILPSKGTNSARVAVESPWYKISPEDVSQIKKLLKTTNLTQDEIAAKFNITRITVHRIKTGKRWAHVEAAT